MTEQKQSFTLIYSAKDRDFGALWSIASKVAEDIDLSESEILFARLVQYSSFDALGLRNKLITDNLIPAVKVILAVAVGHGIRKGGNYGNLGKTEGAKFEAALQMCKVTIISGKDSDPSTISMARIVAAFPDLEYKFRLISKGKLIDDGPAASAAGKIYEFDAAILPVEMQFSGACHLFQDDRTEGPEWIKWSLFHSRQLMQSKDTDVTRERSRAIATSNMSKKLFSREQVIKVKASAKVASEAAATLKAPIKAAVQPART